MAGPHIPLTVTVSPAVYEALRQRGHACHVGPAAIAQSLFDAALGMLRVIGQRAPLELPPEATPASATPVAALPAVTGSDCRVADPVISEAVAAPATETAETPPASEEDARRGYSAAQAKVVRALKDLGSTEREIARQTGLSRDVIRMILWGTT